MVCYYPVVSDSVQELLAKEDDGTGHEPKVGLSVGQRS